MRTTLNIDDEIMRRLKHIAADTRTSLTAVIEQRLRAGLSDLERTPAKAKPFRMITFPGKLCPGIDPEDLNHTGRLLDLMEEDKNKRLYGSPRH